MLESKNSHMRWYILSLALLTNFLIAGAGRYVILVLFSQISAELDLNLVAIGAVWGMDALAAVFICLPSGMLLDRLGIRKTAAAFCLLAGITCIIRGFADSFAALAVATFLYGVAAAISVSLGPKVISYYFRGSGLGFMNALLVIPLLLGQMSGTLFGATWLSPVLNGWRNVFFVYAVPCVIIGLLWLTIKDIPSGGTSILSQVKPPRFRQAFSQLIRMPYLWVLGIIGFAYVGNIISLAGYLPLYLRNIGWAPVNADGALTLMLAVSCIGLFPLVYLSDRVKNRRMFVFFLLLIASIAVSVMYFTRDGTAILIVLIICGLLRGSVGALLNALLLEKRGIKPEYMGTAAGIMSTINMLGGFVMPPIGNGFAAANPALPFLFWAAVPAVLTFLFFFLKTNPDKNEIQDH
jgi:MFS transporter, NNP family, nitrate/nitrite transporter